MFFFSKSKTIIEVIILVIEAGYISRSDSFSNNTCSESKSINIAVFAKIFGAAFKFDESIKKIIKSDFISLFMRYNS